MAYKKYDAYHLGMQPEEVKEALEGGGGGGGALPDITIGDAGKILVVGNDGKLNLFKDSYTLTFNSDDMTNWTVDYTFEQLATIISTSPVPSRFNMEFNVMNSSIGYSYNVIGGIISKMSNSLISFMLSPTAYVTITDSDSITISLD